jgi:apolipoprotein D and lipocalin family protein
MKHFNKCKLALLACLCLSLIGLQCRADSDPRVVSQVDLNRYAGLWYEIGHNPNFFQGSCERSTANYTLQSDGAIHVLNTCYRNNEVYDSIEGTATVTNPAEPAKLVVDFGFFRRGDYWIVALDRNYQWAVVSGPGKSSLFLLARKAPMNKALLEEILRDLQAEGFDTSRIVYDQY